MIKSLIFTIVASLVRADSDDPAPCADEFKPNWYNTTMPYCDKETGTII